MERLGRLMDVMRDRLYPSIYVSGRWGSNGNGLTSSPSLYLLLLLTPLTLPPPYPSFPIPFPLFSSSINKVNRRLLQPPSAQLIHTDTLGGYGRIHRTITLRINTHKAQYTQRIPKLKEYHIVNLTKQKVKFKKTFCLFGQKWKFKFSGQSVNKGKKNK